MKTVADPTLNVCTVKMSFQNWVWSDIHEFDLCFLLFSLLLRVFYGIDDVEKMLFSLLPPMIKLAMIQVYEI